MPSKFLLTHAESFRGARQGDRQQRLRSYGACAFRRSGIRKTTPSKRLHRYEIGSVHLLQLEFSVNALLGRMMVPRLLHLTGKHQPALKTLQVSNADPAEREQQCPQHSICLG